MPKRKTNTENQSPQKSEPKTFGYVVGRSASDQEHPDKKSQNDGN